jgi:hypothetical protein
MAGDLGQHGEKASPVRSNRVSGDGLVAVLNTPLTHFTRPSKRLPPPWAPQRATEYLAWLSTESAGQEPAPLLLRPDPPEPLISLAAPFL